MDVDLYKNTLQKLVELIHANHLQDALELAEQALKVFPENKSIKQLLVVILIGVRNFIDAEKITLELLEIHPNAADYNNLSIIKKSQGKFEDALSPAKLAIDINPDVARYWFNLATVLHAVERDEEAFEAINKAINLEKNDEYVYTKGGFYFNKCKTLEAIRYFKEAIQIKPKPEYMVEMFYALAKTKQYKEAWQFHEYRFETSNQAKRIPLGLKLPVMFEKKNFYEEKICICFEQGLGDNIMFSRFLEPFSKLAPNSYLLTTDDDLKGFVKNINIAKSNSILAGTTHVVCMMSLPYHLGTQEIPKPIYHYKHAPIHSDKKRIGIVWAGSAFHPADHFRSTHLSDFECILNDQSVQVCSFMKDKRKRKRTGSDEIIDYAEGFDEYKIIDFASQLSSITDTMRLLDEIDLLITVDTSVAHIAGSMGVPTYLLVNEICDWRWGENTELSDWYPSIKICRKKSGTTYKELIEETYKKIRSE